MPDCVLVLPSPNAPADITLPALGNGSGPSLVTVQALIDIAIDSSVFEFIQSVPSTMWTIAHNLDRYADVTLYDETGEQMFADVRHDTRNIVTITFSKPITGVARID